MRKAYRVGLLLLLTGCLSTGKTKDGLKSQDEQQTPTDKEFALLKTEVTSLKERILTIERNVESLLRFERSGLMPNSNLNPAPQADVNYTIAPPPRSLATSNSPASDDVSLLIADLEIKIQQEKCQEVLPKLLEVDKSFPNRKDNDHISILTIQCYFKLNEYESSLENIRNFYLRFPKSQEFLQAKLFEGNIYDKLSSKEKAIRVYKEVVALGPKTGYAQIARNELQRLRDEE